MVRLLIALYRANPYRPHCNSAAGVHTVLCRLAAPLTEEKCRPAPPLP